MFSYAFIKKIKARIKKCTKTQEHQIKRTKIIRTPNKTHPTAGIYRYLQVSAADPLVSTAEAQGIYR